jgi:hypothetical protein
VWRSTASGGPVILASRLGSVDSDQKECSVDTKINFVNKPTGSLPEELIVWDVPFPRTVTEKLNRVALAEESVGRRRLLADRLES